MRISDWSSDVCSSDLGEQPAADASDEGGGQRQRVGDGEDGVRYDRRRDFGRRPAVGHRRYHDLPLRSRQAAGGGDLARSGRGGQPQAARDRKRGVSGEDVSVRVYIGGRWMSKKTRREIE